MGAADPIFKTPTQAPAAPVASPAPLAPYDPDPYYGTNTKTPAATPAPVATPAPAVAPTAPQQPQYNPFMQTYGQNNTPQQQMFNRFPQRFQQPQPVAQPAQGPVYADQSLNAPGNQPQQFQQPQYGRFGRGFMPQNRFGYDRQLDQLRGQGQYGQQQGAQQAAFMNNLLSGQQQSPEEYARQRGYQHDPAPSAAPADAEAAWNRTTQQAQFAPGTDMVKAKQDFMQRYNPRPQQPGGMQQAAFMNSLLNGQPLSGQPSAPVGGKGGGSSPTGRY